jgi:hypothetical protein
MNKWSATKFTIRASKKLGLSTNHPAIKAWSLRRPTAYRYPGPATASSRISPSEKRIQRSQADLRFSEVPSEFIKPANAVT